MDNKKFKKLIKVLVPVTDKQNKLVIEPGTKGKIILSDLTGTFKVGVDMADLKDAIDEARVVFGMFEDEEEKEPEKEIPDSGIDFDINSVGYGDEEENQ